jgi:hypothetical protein
MSNTDVTTFPETVVLFPKADDAAVTYAKGVITSITGNPNFNPPPPELTELESETDTYEKANVAARDKSSVAVKARNAARRKVRNTLRHLRDRIQAAAEAQGSAADAAALIVAAGMHVKKVTKRNKPPVRARHGALSGGVVLDALRVAATAVYFWQFSTDQKNWSDVPMSMKAKVVVNGLTPGQVYYFRFRAETRKGPVDYSQVVSLMVL